MIKSSQLPMLRFQRLWCLWHTYTQIHAYIHIIKNNKTNWGAGIKVMEMPLDMLGLHCKGLAENKRKGDLNVHLTDTGVKKRGL